MTQDTGYRYNPYATDDANASALAQHAEMLRAQGEVAASGGERIAGPPGQSPQSDAGVQGGPLAFWQQVGTQGSEPKAGGGHRT